MGDTLSEELRVKLLGSPAAFVGDEPVTGFVSTKTRALLYYLAATGEAHRRDALAALLWSDVPDTTARKNLRDVLSNLRRLIGPFILITRQQVRLNPDAPIMIDSQVLSGTLTAVRDMGTAAIQTDALHSLAEVADPHLGEFLAGFYAPDAPLFEEWMLAERAHLQWELGQAMEKLTEYSLAFEDYEEAEAYARRQLELDCYRERAHRQLMTALALSDRRAEAVAHYETLTDLLWRELGLEPAEKTQELAGKIQGGETIKLKGKFQAPTGNLPPQLTSFVGRESEIEEICRLLKENRLLTLTGAGGSGKTRLAIQVAVTAARNYAGGETYVSLASTKKAEQVVKTIARAFNVLEQPNRNLGETLQRYLARKNKLLILDNFEHVLAAAPVISDLLCAAPHLSVLITSREALNLSGEHVYLVPLLALPDPEDDGSLSELIAVDSVDLFVQRAGMVSQDFALTKKNSAAVGSICQRLDGLPLAIELAAARTKLFSPQQILERLDDRLGLLVGGPRDLPRRQRTLRETIEWSYNLLEKEEQELFARLAVFNGGRTIEAVEAVCGGEGVEQPLRRLESLLNINLLFQEPGPGGESRLYMLETLHDYARERLRESGEERRFKNSHLDYYLQVVEEMAPGYTERRLFDLFRQTDAEMDNIKTAFEWAMASEQIEKAARLLTVVNYYLRYQTENLVEGYRLANRLLPYVEQISAAYRVLFLVGASELAFHNNDLDSYHHLARQAVRLAHNTGDKNLVAWSLTQMIDCSEDAEEIEQSIKYGEESLALFSELGNKQGMAYALNRLGEVYKLGGELEQAKQVYEASLALCKETGDIFREIILMENLGLVAYLEGDYERAKAFLMYVLSEDYLARSMRWVVCMFAELSGPMACLGEPLKAARILGGCHGLMSELGIDYFPFDQPVVEKCTADTRMLLNEVAFEEAWVEGQLMTYEQLVGYVLGEEGEQKISG